MYKPTLRQRSLFNDAQDQEHQITTREFVEQCRVVGKSYARKHGEVTTDDLRRLVIIPDWINPSVLGQVFGQDPTFKKKHIPKKREMNKGGGGYVDRWVIRKGY